MQPGNVETRAHELKSLEKAIGHHDLGTALRKWVGDSTGRGGLLANSVWGSIRWPKSLGRPAAPTLAAGFIVEASFWNNVWYIAEDGTIVDKCFWFPLTALSVWDRSDDPGHYRVNYMFFAAEDYNHRVKVRFSDFPWEHGVLFASGYETLKPAGFEFHADGSMLALPDIAVEHHVLALHGDEQ